jgi:hypothetical protein
LPWLKHLLCWLLAAFWELVVLLSSASGEFKFLALLAVASVAPRRGGPRQARCAATARLATALSFGFDFTVSGFESLTLGFVRRQ